MKREFRYFIVLILMFFASFGMAQNFDANNKLRLYTDRNYTLSGDTLWFKVWIPTVLEETSNVVHIQLYSSGGQIINTVAGKSTSQWINGFLSIPDSLSTGVYFVSAFVNEQRILNEINIQAKTLFVYNRFDEGITKITLPKLQLISRAGKIEGLVDIKTAKTTYKTRSVVEGDIHVHSDDILHATVSAHLFDPLANAAGGYISSKFVGAHKIIPAFAEKDGILISGRVLDQDKNPQGNKLVILSISSEPPYFDYCISDKNGGFNFFLYNAIGNADLILQTVSTEREELLIEPSINCLEQLESYVLETKTLSQPQSDFIATVIQASFIQKLFNRTTLSDKSTFEMPTRYTVPFYGNPTRRITPSEFFDLPDFREISRELLQGLQYRTRNGDVTFRLLNSDRGRFFDNEPLRLLNGIPVFKNSYFTSLKSTDINYIDIVQNERVFGDMQINGVMAVSLKDKSNAWLAQQANIFQFKLPCLQTPKIKSYLKQDEVGSLQPDVRKNYLWETLPIGENRNFQFVLSDMKGKVEITVEGVTKSNVEFKTSKIIEVK